MTTQIRGSVPPLITPFKKGAIDEHTYADMVSAHITAGSHGILVNGTTAEPSVLSVEERNRMVDIAIDAAGSRIPVIVASGSQSLAETRVLTEHAVRAGASALLIITPYYIRPPIAGMVEYYLELDKMVDIPWMIYHIPGRAAVSVTLDMFKALKARAKHFVGMKHAVNDLGFVTECMVEFGEEFRIFVGLEELSFPMMAVGACGLMNAVGNLCPEPLAGMCEAVWNNDLRAARELHESLLEINQSIFYATNPIPLKYMMKCLGRIKDNEHRLPMLKADKDLQQRLDKVLANAKLITASK
jgi:4-hydroxy-tetrahydrodipicolinate synthase